MVDLLKPKGKAILLGDQAIVRGALEAGIGLVAAYPGTPSSEIAETFSEIAKDADIYFEYSTNEKVATEVAAGAAFSGVRSMTTFKHFGFNVASDSIFPLPYHGVEAGMVIVCADDPGMHSSGQNEEDSRYLARTAHLPLIEPADPQECKDFTKFAFEFSEKIKIPVMMRITTRTAHASGIVSLNDIKKGKTTGFYKKGKWKKTMPPYIIDVHKELNEMLNDLKNSKELNSLNKIIPGKGSTGIIAIGVSYLYAMEAMKNLNLKLPVLKLGHSWPVPEKQISDFIKNLKEVLILEELEPVIENDIKAIAKDVNPKLIIHGKDMLPSYSEFKPDMIEEVVAKLTKTKYVKPKINELKLPRRIPVLCPGCPHRATFWAVKQAAGKEAIYGGDIGCYIIGVYPPNNTQDYIISMGAGSGIAHGIKKVSKQKTVAFVGDSTFFHAGIPPLINNIYNNADVLSVILDNRWTAMTGHQPHPGTGIDGIGNPAKAVKVEEIAKGCGVEAIEISNAFNIKETIEKAKKLLAQQKPSVLVSKGECRLQFMRNARKKSIAVPKFQIDVKKCTKCRKCLYEFGCPAIQRKENGDYYIDEELCWGCSACSQVCPANAISAKPIKPLKLIKSVKK